jgi:hypothetical protein
MACGGGSGIPVHKMTKNSCKVQENFVRRYFVKHFLAGVLLALPDIFQHCSAWTALYVTSVDGSQISSIYEFIFQMLRLQRVQTYPDSFGFL